MLIFQYKKNNQYIIEMDIKKSRREYQRKYYYKNREQQLLKMRQYNNKSYEIIQEYQRKYYLRNRDAILFLKAEHYINKKQERKKMKIMLLFR